MFDYPSKDDIERISMDLLMQSKSIDIFPTPVDSIVRFVNIKIDNSIDLSNVDDDYIRKLSSDSAIDFLSSLNQVRGVLDRKDKVILLDKSQLPCRQNFVKLHETGHEILTWQKDFLLFSDDDITLNINTTEEFEAEANYFASTILFQNDRFEILTKKFKLGISAPMTLAKKFGASIHSAMRKYVECSPKRCALLVLENIPIIGCNPICDKRDLFYSENFLETFGVIDFPERFGYKWDFVKDCYFGKKINVRGNISLDTENGTADFNYHFFNNTYNAFVLIFPIGEEKC